MCSASKKASLALICKCPSPTKLNVYIEKTFEESKKQSNLNGTKMNSK